jgi:carboxyl-terminal processing protease
MRQNYFPAPLMISAVVALILSISCGILLFKVRAIANKDEFEYLELFYDVFSDVNKYYIEELRPEILEAGAIRGLLIGANPYNDYIIPGKDRDEFSSFSEKGHSGIIVGYKPKTWTVMGILPGSAAHKAGIKVGDRLFQIDDKVLQNYYLSEIYEKLGGTPGQKHTLTVFRGHMDSSMEQKSIEFELEPIPPFESLHVKTLENNIGYMHIVNISAKGIIEKVKTTLKNFERQDTQALIIDLRNNIAGDIKDGYRFADLFLPDGLDMGFCRKNAQSDENKFVSNDPYECTISPLIILIDSSTSSAAEVVVGAFKDLQRAHILGSTTFGKGVRIERYNIDGAMLRLVTGIYHTPKGDPIFKNGVDPDIELNADPYFLANIELEEDPLIIRALELISAHYAFDKQSVNA